MPNDYIDRVKLRFKGQKNYFKKYEQFNKYVMHCKGRHFIQLDNMQRFYELDLAQHPEQPVQNSLSSLPLLYSHDSMLGPLQSDHIKTRPMRARSLGSIKKALRAEQLMLVLNRPF